MAGFADFATGLMNNPLFLMGINTMGASGPSLQPVGLGQALSSGIANAVQQQMKNAELQRNQFQLGILNSMGSPQAALSPQPSAQPVQQVQQEQQLPQDYLTSPLTIRNPMEDSGAPTTLSAGMASKAPVSKQPSGISSMMAAQSQNSQQAGQLSGLATTMAQQDGSDPTAPLKQQYQYFLKGAMAGLPGYSDLASQTLQQIKSQWHPMTPDEVSQYTQGAPVKGYTYLINGSGDVKTVGEKLYSDVPLQDPITGQIYHARLNNATGMVSPYNSVSSPSGQRAKPAPQTSSPGSGSAQPATGGTPLPGRYETVAQGVANYDIAPPNAGSGRGAVYASNILARAKEINPDFKAENYQAAVKAAKDFSTGQQGKAVNSFNVGLKHLDTLDQLTSALNNGNIKAVNSLANSFAKQTGSSVAPTNFEAAKKIVGDEIVKAIVGAGGGVSDREEAAATINAANSPAQLQGVINTYKQLMVGQLEGLKQQYETTTFKKDFDKKLSPEALRLLQQTTPSSPTAAPKVISWNDLQ